MSKRTHTSAAKKSSQAEGWQDSPADYGTVAGKAPAKVGVPGGTSSQAGLGAAPLESSEEIQPSLFANLVEKFASDRNEAIEVIRNGLPASVLKEASDFFEVPLSRIRAIVRLPDSTAARLVQKQGEVDASVSERIWRLADVLHMATDVFEDVGAAKAWLRSPNRVFMNSAPMDYLDTEPGAMSVRQVLTAIATGGAA